MADTKLSALNELAVTPAGSDELYIRDVSEPASSESKRITVTNLLSGAPTATETIEYYSSANLANGANYTPGDPGIFYEAGNGGYRHQYFSNVNTAWYQPSGEGRTQGATTIGDGTNYRVMDIDGGVLEYFLMRHYLSTGTYERVRDEDLAAGAIWTPGDSGFFSGGQEGSNVDFEINYPIAGWTDSIYATGSINRPMTILIGDGSRLRIKNDGVSTRWTVTMRAVMT